MQPDIHDPPPNPSKHIKLHGRAFYESVGSPKMVLAPMVDQSEFAWRMLTRSFLPPTSSTTNPPLLAYTPMFHSRLFADTPKYREQHFQPLSLKTAIPESPPHLDGNPSMDRPLFVQFCANDPDELLQAAQHVAPFCDAVDLNLGCPQGIARRGHYGAFLQEDWDLIARMIRKLHDSLDVPVTAKMRILETPEKTLAYAKTILDAGASIITVHGRRREQKGHNTGLADWGAIRHLRENLPAETVIFANGNVLSHEDLGECLRETGADAVMSAEGNLHDPTIFAAEVPVGEEGREYWRGRDGNGGWRVDAVLRRYMDIIHRYVLGVDPPTRGPMFITADYVPEAAPENGAADLHITPADESPERPAKRQKLSKKQKKELAKKGERKKFENANNANMTAMQPHLFHLLRPLITKHHNVRDALARSRAGDVEAYENVLALVEEAVKQGLLEYEREQGGKEKVQEKRTVEKKEEAGEKINGRPKKLDPYESSLLAVERCKRPWWICQPYVRPLPNEALEKGAMTLSKKERMALEKVEKEVKDAGLEPEGRIEKEEIGNGREREEVEVPREGVVCG
ncbi:FMN-linked oxidoreductase [Mytilinidion resinicola]|uniref:tRNA-dihydrouridine(16/17) synthase [NAD(P)(+)] n=1 Tax=Mytilinidion resinicola TaxID=574789 RepID=A0A6A6Z457_9PEZI|nr:FMN-linked oxidoreductase [Mytilinidion resinicola]KAF2815866.1 FMN-linked oxidoreductase [Mytilinidion resinicola]